LLPLLIFLFVIAVDFESSDSRSIRTEPSFLIAEAQ